MNNLGIWKNLRNYKQNSLLVFNFMLVFGITVLIITSVSLGFYFYYDGLVRQTIKDSNNDALCRIRDAIDMVAIDVDRLSIRICNDSEVEQFLKYKIPADMNYETAQKVNRIKNILTYSNFTSYYIAAVELYSSKNEYIVSSLYDSGPKWKMRTLPESILTQTQNVWTESTTPLGEDNRLRYISNYRRIPLRGSDKLGLVMIHLDVEQLKEVIKSASSKNYEEIFIVDEDDTILFSTNMDAIGKKSGDTELLTNTKKDGKEMFVTSTQSSYNKWKYISFVLPEEYYENKTEVLNRLFVISILFSIVIAFIGSLLISVKVFEPIRILMQIVQDTVEEKTPTTDFKENKSNELRLIIGNILDSYQSKYEMKQELLQRQMLLEKAQMIALQAQISPHFMYNTLENINWKVLQLTGGHNEATEMIAILSNLLRNSLETGESIISVKKEIEHAKIYVEILKRRHDDAFEIVWNIEEAVLDCRIVKITLQPIIENALYHGIMNVDKKGIITINGYIKEECSVIEVINEGKPIENELIDQLNENMQSDLIKEDSQIGISNVNQRIKLSFGEKYGISISKTKEGNTIVKILLPKV